MSNISSLPSYLLLVCLLLSLAAGAQQNPPKPEVSRFTRQVLDDDLNEPMELAVAPDGIVYYVERPGLVNRLDPKTGTKTRLAKLPVRFLAEDGLMGIALDPGFASNRFVYLYFGDPVPEGEQYFNVLARFEIGDSLRQASRKDLLRIPVTHEGVSHSAGSITFDRQGIYTCPPATTPTPSSRAATHPPTTSPAGSASMPCVRRATPTTCGAKSCAFTPSPTARTPSRPATCLPPAPPAPGPKST
jgi:hypothetical protein